MAAAAAAKSNWARHDIDEKDPTTLERSQEDQLRVKERDDEAEGSPMSWDRAMSSTALRIEDGVFVERPNSEGMFTSCCSAQSIPVGLWRIGVRVYRCGWEGNKMSIGIGSIGGLHSFKDTKDTHDSKSAELCAYIMHGRVTSVEYAPHVRCGGVTVATGLPRLVPSCPEETDLDLLWLLVDVTPERAVVRFQRAEDEPWCTCELAGPGPWHVVAQVCNRTKLRLLSLQDDGLPAKSASKLN
eukprot:m.93653 g.93653  ORF g.93653 m.93653 type:complete len:242 (-) comp15098_c0_seq1:40-765(-)